MFPLFIWCTDGAFAGEVGVRFERALIVGVSAWPHGDQAERASTSAKLLDHAGTTLSLGMLLEAVQEPFVTAPSEVVPYLHPVGAEQRHGAAQEVDHELATSIKRARRSDASSARMLIDRSLSSFARRRMLSR